MYSIQFFTIFSLFFTFQNLSVAQVFTAGAWTGYPDGIGITEMVMRDSFLYLNTHNGTSVFNTVTRQSVFFCDMGNPALPPRFNQINSSAVDAQGNLWRIFEHKLTKISPSGLMEPIGPEPEGGLFVLRSDKNGVIWAGLTSYSANPGTSTAVMAKFNGNTWEYIYPGYGTGVIDIAFDNQNQPFVYLGSYGIFKYNGNNFIFISGSPELANLAISNDGQMAACGSSSSTILKYYNNGVWTTIGLQFGPRFQFAVFDSNNTLWACSKSGAVYKLVNNTLQLALTAPKNYRTGVENYFDKVIGFDPAGQLWLGSYDGLFVAPDPTIDHWEFVPTAPLLSPGQATSIAASDDTIWIGNEAGVTRLYNQTFEKIDTIARNVSALWYDTIRHGLWVASPGLVRFYQGSTQVLFDIAPLLPYATSNKNIASIVGDIKGNIWLRTSDSRFRFIYSIKG